MHAWEACIWLKNKDSKKHCLKFAISNAFLGIQTATGLFLSVAKMSCILSEYDLNSGLLTLSGFCNHFCSRFCLLELNGIFRTRVVEIQRSKEQSHGICRCPTQTSVVFIRHQREENKQEGTTPIRNTHFVFRFATVS